MVGEPNAVLENAEQQSSRAERPAVAGGWWGRLRARRLPVTSFLAVGVVLIMIFVAVFAEFIAPYDPLAGDYSVIRQPPSAAHLLGTDDVGRDVLSRLIYGARTSLVVGFGSVVIGDVVGLFWGIASGYIGRRFDLFSQRLLEVVLAFPGLILATMLLLVLGAGIQTVIIAIAVTRIPSSTRVIRSVALATKGLLFVESARVSGASTLRIMLRHIAPACVAPFLVIFTASLGIAITTEAALSFVGVGVPPPAPSWGTMLAGAAIGKFNPLWWLAIFPGLAITITVLAINLAGDSLRDLLDPQLRRRVD
jgi:ABC-type dipeptide/oligopeptide/nickel transport system permease subunit